MNAICLGVIAAIVVMFVTMAYVSWRWCKDKGGFRTKIGEWNHLINVLRLIISIFGLLSVLLAAIKINMDVIRYEKEKRDMRDSQLEALGVEVNSTLKKCKSILGDDHGESYVQSLRCPIHVLSYPAIEAALQSGVIDDRDLRKLLQEAYWQSENINARISGIRLMLLLRAFIDVPNGKDVDQQEYIKTQLREMLEDVELVEDLMTNASVKCGEPRKE